MPCGLPEPDEQPKPPDPRVIAFIQGAKWWEHRRTNATMWQSDQNLAAMEAERRLSAGSLGVTLDQIIDTLNKRDQ